MNIVTDYEIISNNDSTFTIKYFNIPPCHICHETIKYRDSRIRYVKYPGGSRKAFHISRYKCERCNVLCSLLPDIMVPYKQYSSETICDVIDGVLTSDDLEAEDYPTEKTMFLWLEWFCKNLQYIDEYLRSLKSRISGKPVTGSVVEVLRTQHKNWLGKIIVMVYNSGGALTPLRG